MQRAETARLAIAHAASRVRTQARTDGPVVAEVGCGLLRAALPDARGRRRAMPAMRARRGVCARAPEQRGGLVRSASVLCPAGTARLRRLVVFSFAFSTRPGGGKTPTGNPTQMSRRPSPTTALRAVHLPVTQPPQGAWGRNRPNCAPMPSRLHTITSRHPRAPPARAARSRRPLKLAKLARAARFPPLL